MRLNATVDWDESTSTLTISRNGANFAKIKFAVEGIGTMCRAAKAFPRGEDCDNFWLAIKPADDMVFSGQLFSRKTVVVTRLDFTFKP